MVPMIEGLPGGAEWIVLIVVALLLFGGTRLAGIGKGAGRAIREFKEETQSLSGAEKAAQAQKAAATVEAPAAAKPAAEAPAATSESTTPAA